MTRNGRIMNQISHLLACWYVGYGVLSLEASLPRQKILFSDNYPVVEVAIDTPATGRSLFT